MEKDGTSKDMDGRGRKREAKANNQAKEKKENPVAKTTALANALRGQVTWECTDPCQARHNQAKDVPTK